MIATTGRNFGRSIRRHSRTLATGVVLAASTVAASAQDANEGVDAVVSAINGLKPDLGTVVAAAIGVALISIGAMVAVGIGKRLMGK